MRSKAINKLIYNWRQSVENGDMEPEAMVESLEEQVSGYRDMSFEDLDGDRELAEIMGYEVETMTDAQVVEWQEIVNEAAQRYLNEEKVMWMEAGETREVQPDELHVPDTIEVQVPSGRFWEPSIEETQALPEEEWIPEDELPFQ